MIRKRRNTNYSICVGDLLQASGTPRNPISSLSRLRASIIFSFIIFSSFITVYPSSDTALFRLSHVYKLHFSLYLCNEEKIESIMCLMCSSSRYHGETEYLLFHLPIFVRCAPCWKIRFVDKCMLYVKRQNTFFSVSRYPSLCTRNRSFLSLFSLKLSNWLSWHNLKLVKCSRCQTRRRNDSTRPPRELQ